MKNDKEIKTLMQAIKEGVIMQGDMLYNPHEYEIIEKPMKTTIEKVKEFHDAFGVKTEPKPTTSFPEIQELRINLLQEELDELKDALLSDDIVETLDALIDLQYVLDGAFLAFGMHRLKDAAFAEVHASNMSKLGIDGKPILRCDGKILKGENYFKPDLRKFLNT